MTLERMNQRLNRLDDELTELNKKLSAMMLSVDEKKLSDEQYAAIYELCCKVAHKAFVDFLQEKNLPIVLSENAMNQLHGAQAQDAENDVRRAVVVVGFPYQQGCIWKEGLSGSTKIIGSMVDVRLDDEEVLSVMYKEDCDPESTFSAYEARAKAYALSVFAAMRARGGGDLSSETHPCSEDRYTIKINSPDNTISAEDVIKGRSFRVSCEEGEFVVYENGKPVRASHHHSLKIINLAIGSLKDEGTSIMKRIGRCMGYLQVAAETEAMASGTNMDAVMREALLRDFNTPPFKKGPDDWIQPGLTYLKGRI